MTVPVTNEQTSTNLHSCREQFKLTNSRKTYYDISHQISSKRLEDLNIRHSNMALSIIYHIIIGQIGDDQYSNQRYAGRRLICVAFVETMRSISQALLCSALALLRQECHRTMLPILKCVRCCYTTCMLRTLAMYILTINIRHSSLCSLFYSDFSLKIVLPILMEFIF